MEVLFLSILALSSVMSIYYVISERLSYRFQLKITEDCRKTLADVEQLREELRFEQDCLREIARKLQEQSLQQQLQAGEASLTDPGKKPYLN